MKRLVLISMIAGASGLGAATGAHADVLSVQLQILGGEIPVLQIETETCGHAYPSVVVANARKLLDASAVLELKTVPECTTHAQGTASFSVPIGAELARLGLDPERTKLFWQESGKPGEPRPVDPRGTGKAPARAGPETTNLLR